MLHGSLYRKTKQSLPVLELPDLLGHKISQILPNLP